MGNVLKRGGIESEHRTKYENLSAMNRTSGLLEFGSHLSPERSGATEKTVTVQDILDLNRQNNEKGSHLEELSRSVA